MRTGHIPVKKSDKLSLHLFVSGMSPKSMEAIENIERICKKYLAIGYRLDITDIYKNPEIAAEHHIVFSPSLIKTHPLPRRILIGTLADTEKVLRALGINDKI